MSPPDHLGDALRSILRLPLSDDRVLEVAGDSIAHSAAPGVKLSRNALADLTALIASAAERIEFELGVEAMLSLGAFLNDLGARLRVRGEGAGS